MIELPVLGWDDVVRFWSYVDRKAENDCWLWLGNMNSRVKSKQPAIRIQGITYVASRIAYYIQYKIDPNDLLVCHECDNRLCMNGRHLWLGTQKDNMMDCSIKGRLCLSNAAKTSPEQRREIHRLKLEENWGTTRLSNRFGVTPQQIRNIIAEVR